jgi:hypothetical protein
MITKRFGHRPVAFMQLAVGAALLAMAFPGVGLAATAPSLGAASSFSVLGGSTVTNTGASDLAWDVGVSPGSAITGFPRGITHGATHPADAVAAQAQGDVTTAYNALGAQACNFDITGVDLTGLTLIPGVYCFTSGVRWRAQSCSTL